MHSFRFLANVRNDTQTTFCRCLVLLKKGGLAEKKGTHPLAPSLAREGDLVGEFRKHATIKSFATQHSLDQKRMDVERQITSNKIQLNTRIKQELLTYEKVHR